MKYVAMTLVAVMAMSGIAMAEYTIDIGGGANAVVSDPVDLGYSLYGLTVHINGAKSFESLAVEGGVHQVFAPDGTTQTPYLSSVGNPAGVQINPTPFDTHFLFDSGDIAIGAAADNGVLETMTAPNTPEELPKSYTHYYYDGVGYLNQSAFPGMGTFDTSGDAQGMAFTFPGELTPEGYDLLYVVIPQDTLLTGTTVVGGAKMSMDIPLCVVPEPGTIMLLLAGAMCLLGIRRR